MRRRSGDRLSTLPEVTTRLDDPLVDREREIEAIDRLLARAGHRAGGLLIEGPPGIGKSRLLAMARHQPADLRVVNARGSEIERDIPFAVVRQLLEPVLHAASEQEREELLAGAGRLAERALVDPLPDQDDSAEPVSATLHGLYWFTANMVSRSPVLMIIDDVQWADVASLRWLAYLTQRIDGLNLLLLLAARPRQSHSDEQLWDALAGVPEFETIRPRGLTLDGVARLTQAVVSLPPEPEFVAACHELTRGNPFLIRELLGELAAGGVAPTAANVPLVERQTSRTVSRAALGRLRRLPPECRAVADAVVVAGDPCELPLAAAIAGLDEDTASRAADALAEAFILDPGRPLNFVHPLVRSSVYADMGVAERHELHRQAASSLTSIGAPVERIALHLLASEPRADAETVDILRRAARQAQSRGATDAAVVNLTRAWQEPPPPEVFGDVALELGTAERHAGRLQAAIGHLREAIGATTDPRRRALAAGELCTALMYTGEQNAAPVVALLDAIRALPDTERDLGLRLENLRALAAEGSRDARRLVDAAGSRFGCDPDAPKTRADRIHVASLGLEAAYREPAHVGRTLARRAVEDGDLLRDPRPGEHSFFMAPFALQINGAFDEAIEMLSRAMDVARAQGSAFAFAQAAECRAFSWLSMGSLAEAEADAELALVHPGGAVRIAVITMIEVRLARGDVAGADFVWQESGFEGAPTITRGSVLNLQARAHLRMAQGRAQEALADLRACGRIEDDWDIRTPVLTQWRADAALILSAVGEIDEAEALIDEELARCRRFGASRPLGIALRAAGVVHQGAAGLRDLQEAVDILEGSPARLEYAGALYDLGAGLRRSGRRADARPPLTAAVELAVRCGATSLASAAHDELVAAGARPRRDPLHHRTALTASELRVARLARDGLTNREIAQALFVTEKTIEVHLTSSYRKLGIGSRSQLARMLSQVDPAS